MGLPVTGFSKCSPAASVVTAEQLDEKRLQQRTAARRMHIFRWVQLNREDCNEESRAIIAVFDEVINSKCLALEKLTESQLDRKAQP